MTSITDPRVMQLKRDIEQEERAGNHTAARILRERLRALLTPRRDQVSEAKDHYYREVVKR